jgi:hypothetical protein
VPGALRRRGRGVDACPGCGQPIEERSLEGAVGFGLFVAEDVPLSLLEAIALRMPDPDRLG